jgi:mannitol-1-phosphate 5-dehydrogenase
MTLTRTRTFVGFGFGAIQSGLFLYEAFQSGEFRRLVVAEIMPHVVSAVRCAGGSCCVNIAYHDRVEKDQIDSIEIEDPATAPGRQCLIDAIAEAEEIATAVPSVESYSSERSASLHRILAAGLCKKVELDGPRTVVYTAENHNQAAEILEKHVFAQVPKEMREVVHSRVQFLNTVIGKMSQVVSDPEEIHERGLATITPGLPRAFLVESFNKIFISRIQFFEPFRRGIAVFEEKDDLIPFEEAKLYGHNATHALAGYIGKLKGIQYIADLREIPGMVPFLRAAFIQESGQSLIRKYGLIDQLFTPQGYSQYADGLLERMMNPFLMDTIERVTRDTRRKLGWNDRLIGTMRLALSQGVKPNRYAFGAAAALASMDPSILDGGTPVNPTLNSIWPETTFARDEKDIVIALIKDALQKLKDWRDLGYPNIETFFRNNQHS